MLLACARLTRIAQAHYPLRPPSGPSPQMSAIYKRLALELLGETIPLCSAGSLSRLSAGPTGPHGSAIAGGVNAGFQTDLFVVRIDSGQID